MVWNRTKNSQMGSRSRAACATIHRAVTAVSPWYLERVMRAIFIVLGLALLVASAGAVPLATPAETRHQCSPGRAISLRILFTIHTPRDTDSTRSFMQAANQPV